VVLENWGAGSELAQRPECTPASAEKQRKKPEKKEALKRKPKQPQREQLKRGVVL
jgi:hypothetical protein